MTSQNFVKLQVWLDEMHAYILIFHDRMITAIIRMLDNSEDSSIDHSQPTCWHESNLYE